MIEIIWNLLPILFYLLLFVLLFVFFYYSSK